MPLRVGFSGPETCNIGYLDPLGQSIKSNYTLQTPQLLRSGFLVDSLPEPQNPHNPSWVAVKKSRSKLRNVDEDPMMWRYRTLPNTNVEPEGRTGLVDSSLYRDSFEVPCLVFRSVGMVALGSLVNQGALVEETPKPTGLYNPYVALTKYIPR